MSRSISSKPDHIAFNHVIGSYRFDSFLIAFRNPEQWITRHYAVTQNQSVRLARNVSTHTVSRLHGLLASATRRIEINVSGDFQVPVNERYTYFLELDLDRRIKRYLSKPSFGAAQLPIWDVTSHFWTVLRCLPARDTTARKTSRC